MSKLTAQERAALADLQPVQEVLRALVIATCALNPPAMPKVGHMLRAATARESLSPVARVMLADLAEGIEGLTGAGTGH